MHNEVFNNQKHIMFFMVYDSGEIVKQRIRDYLVELSFTDYLKNPSFTGVLDIEELWENKSKEIKPNNQIGKDDIILIVNKDELDADVPSAQFWIISPYEGGIAWVDEPLRWEIHRAKRGGNNFFEENPIRLRKSPNLFSTFTIESNQKQVWKAIGQGWPPLTSYRFFIMNQPKVGNRSLNFSRRSFL